MAYAAVLCQNLCQTDGWVDGRGKSNIDESHVLNIHVCLAVVFCLALKLHAVLVTGGKYIQQLRAKGYIQTGF